MNLQASWTTTHRQTEQEHDPGLFVTEKCFFGFTCSTSDLLRGDCQGRLPTHRDRHALPSVPQHPHPSVHAPVSAPRRLHPAVCVATEGACLPASAPPPIAAPSQAPRTHTKNYLSTPFSDTFDELSQYKWVDSTLGNHI